MPVIRFLEQSDCLTERFMIKERRGRKEAQRYTEFGTEGHGGRLNVEG